MPVHEWVGFLRIVLLAHAGVAVRGATPTARHLTTFVNRQLRAPLGIAREKCLESTDIRVRVGNSWGMRAVR